MQANNAIYTPTPETIDVTVYVGDDGEQHADSGPAHLVSLRGDVIGIETARVVSRGNLLPSGTQRWYIVALADGSRHPVIGEGS